MWEVLSRWSERINEIKVTQINLTSTLALFACIVVSTARQSRNRWSSGHRQHRLEKLFICNTSINLRRRDKTCHGSYKQNETAPLPNAMETSPLLWPKIVCLLIRELAQISPSRHVAARSSPWPSTTVARAAHLKSIPVFHRWLIFQETSNVPYRATLPVDLCRSRYSGKYH